MAIFAKEKTEEKKEEKQPEVASVQDVKTEGKKPARNTTHSVAGGSEKAGKKTKDNKTEEIKLGNVTRDIIIEPWITEKAHGAMAENKYIFRVKKEADKKSVKLAIERLYGVKVINVNIINIPAKKRMYGRHEGKKSGYKKAIVKLKEGDKIELFKGV
jgi:large subunit ribosomal protein L23